MSDERMNRHPEFLQETMFQEHGTKVLITNPASDRYLKKAADKLKEKYSQWVDPEVEDSY